MLACFHSPGGESSRLWGRGKGRSAPAAVRMARGLPGILDLLVYRSTTFRGGRDVVANENGDYGPPDVGLRVGRRAIGRGTGCGEGARTAARCGGGRPRGPGGAGGPARIAADRSRPLGSLRLQEAGAAVAID